MPASPAVLRDFKGHILQRVGHYRNNGNKREGTHREAMFQSLVFSCGNSHFSSQLFPSLSSEERGWSWKAERGPDTETEGLILGLEVTS